VDGRGEHGKLGELGGELRTDLSGSVDRIDMAHIGLDLLG
jgi:hypothetical protein